MTGGIASGKSSVAEKLQKLGAGLVNCDKLAHDLYLPGRVCFHKIIEHFGSSILNSDGFIDRKALGNIVFNDKVSIHIQFPLQSTIIYNSIQQIIYTCVVCAFDRNNWTN